MQSNKRTTNKPKVRGQPRLKKNNSPSSGRLEYAPVAMSRSVGPSKQPTVRSNGRLTTISHSEFFVPVQSTTTDFTVSSFPCNPGVASMFPWLSQVAQRYETYKFRKLTFRYHTRAAATQVGTVGLAFDFDAQDDPPTSQMLALSYHDKAADACWKEMRLDVDLRQGDKLPTRYTRVGLPTGYYDLKTLDLGALHIFTDGVAASANLGLMEVDYTVDLFTPQIQNGIGGRTRASAGLDATYLVGSDFSVVEGLTPFTASSTSVLLFNQSFEGILVFRIEAAAGAAADFAPVASASGTAAVLSQTIDAASDLTIAVRVRAVPGTTLTPTMTAVGGVHYVYIYVAAAPYAALGA